MKLENSENLEYLFQLKRELTDDYDDQQDGSNASACSHLLLSSLCNIIQQFTNFCTIVMVIIGTLYYFVYYFVY